MKKGVKIAIIVGIIILIVVAAGGYLFVNDITQKRKITEEFAQIEKLTKEATFDIEKLKEKTSTVVTNGKYATVEKAAKSYASDLFSTAYEIRKLLEDEKMAQLLTTSNYEKDGPEFVETKQYLADTKKQLEDKKAQMLSYIQEEKINSYIEQQNADAYCTNLYKEFLAQDIKMTQTQKDELEKSIDKVISMLNTEEEVINFLVTNKGKWKVQGSQILFDSNDLVTTYNGFVTKLRIL